MMDSLLIVERVVLESLAIGKKQLKELHEDTGLEIKLLFNILQRFLIKNLIGHKQGYYFLLEDQIQRMAAQLNNQESLNNEFRELFVALVNTHFKKAHKEVTTCSELKVKKVWMNDSDERILKSMLMNVENFIQSLGRKQTPERLAGKKVIVWGISTYRDLIDQTLKAV